MHLVINRKKAIAVQSQIVHGSLEDIYTTGAGEAVMQDKQLSHLCIVRKTNSNSAD